MSAQQKVQQHPAFQQAQAKAHYYLAQLDKELSKYPVLVSLEQRTQVPKAYASSELLPSLPCFTLSMPSPRRSPTSLVAHVLDHFRLFNFAEGFALRALLYYFPWYFSFKTLFILWLQLPAFRGAQMAYYSVLRPVLAKCHRTGPARSFSNDTVTAEGLRDRVATATTE
ncbi:hypothetical protein BJV77DRAFT_310080 [Russula vinacea]|nr:hypothetical protein BJV77DRAFT_310080 [Russula vinacea]